MKAMAEQISLHMDVLSTEDLRQIAEADLTGKLDALSTESQFEKLMPLFAQCSSVLICMERLISDCSRNVNRILLRMSNPFCGVPAGRTVPQRDDHQGYETGCLNAMRPE